MANRTKTVKDPADFIMPLYMNGLQGRMLRMPGPKTRNREILFVYGHHASLERQFGLIEILSRYGTVTIPDLPGFGGMQSFYRIHEKPTLDNLADYLASFVKLRYKRKRVTIIATSFGFAVVTRMLQRFPEIAKKVDILISLVGFVHHEDFHIKRRNFWLLRYLSVVGSRRLPAWCIRHVILRPTTIRLAYRLVADKHSKLKDADAAERDLRINFEIGLWHNNDFRTYADTAITMFTLDLCHEQVDLPVYHIAVDHDRYFNNDIVEQHLGVIYNKVEIIRSKMPNHGPTVVATAKDAAPFIPPKLRRLLAQK
jgi:pimeloyl-ACP methyl ester carboxylesterase